MYVVDVNACTILKLLRKHLHSFLFVVAALLSAQVWWFPPGIKIVRCRYKSTDLLKLYLSHICVNDSTSTNTLPGA